MWLDCCIMHIDLTSITGFYQRPMPCQLIPFGSKAGRAIFQQSLLAGSMEGCVNGFALMLLLGFMVVIAVVVALVDAFVVAVVAV